MWSLIVLVTTVAAASAAEKFVDPKPPAFIELRAATTPPIARENSDVTFHAAPKPLAKRAVTTDWASFLGPTHNMFSTETAVLKELPKERMKPVWEMKKGESFGSPAILGDRLVFMHRVGNDEVVECLHPADGRRYWQFRHPSGYRDRYGFNGGPRTSPVIADGRVFAYGAEGKLFCLALETGQVLWQRDLLAEFKVEQNFFGVGATPLVEDGKVIVNVGAPDGPCVAAFDVRTGKMLWGAGKEWGPSYASPIPATVHGKRRVFVFAGGESRPATGGLMCIDPADGRVDFTFPWRGTRVESVNAASPVVVGNSVLVSECYGSGSALVAVQPDGKGRPAWTNPKFGVHFMSSIPKDGFIYGVDGHGPSDAEFVCLNLATGKEVWRAQSIWTEQIAGRRGASEMKVGLFRASLLMVEGRALCLGEYGHLLWLDLTPEGFRELGRTWLFAATETWTPPVLSRGLLYVCQNTRDTLANEPPRLLCYDLRAPE